MEDRAMVDLLWQRDPAGLDALEAKYGPRCRAFAGRLLGDDRDAEECVSDGLLAVWNTVPPKRPEALGGYLFKIVRNLALKKHRDRSAQKRDGSHDLALEELAEVLPHRDTVEGALDAKYLEQAMNDFLLGLPQADRVLFLGRYWFGDSLREAGRRVGISEKNASVRLTRLRKRLKDALMERGVLDG